MLTEKQIVDKLTEMQKSMFFDEHEFRLIDSFSTEFIKNINEIFGDNDGEQLDECGIEHVLDFLKHKWMLTNGVVDDE